MDDFPAVFSDFAFSWVYKLVRKDVIQPLNKCRAHHSTTRTEAMSQVLFPLRQIRPQSTSVAIEEALWGPCMAGHSAYNSGTTLAEHDLELRVRTVQQARRWTSRLTRCQRPVIRLSVEVYLDHLAPSSRAQNSEYVGQVIDPSIGMDPAGHQPTMHQVEVVRGEC